MGTVDSTYPAFPMRSLIRCKAKQHLHATMHHGSTPQPLQEELFQDIANTFFQSVAFRIRYASSRSMTDVDDLEEAASLELAATYRRLIQRQQDSLVQRLNALFLQEYLRE